MGSGVKNHWGFLFFSSKDSIYLFMRDREREAETQAEGEAGSLQGVQHGTQSWVSRIRPRAKGRCQTPEPPTGVSTPTLALPSSKASGKLPNLPCKTRG